MAKEKKEQKNNSSNNVPKWLTEAEKISIIIDLIKEAYQTDCDCPICTKLRKSAESFEEIMRNYLK